MTEAVSEPDPACATAHGQLPPDNGPRALVAVFESPIAEYLVRLGIEVGYRTTLVEPDPGRLAGTVRPHGDRVAVALDGTVVDEHTDVIVTDHDRPELGTALRDALRLPARWIGVIGSPRHPAPHPLALRELGVADDDIARVHRPIGLNIGSRTPAEIALATLAGLIADRNRRPGGFTF
jgi:xanthine/CO dehydrogenase XdhC/CoxF family maturation factor